ncbi:hypothetical protein Micbo1qcDRAFT_180561 [Microdochium bolleyi]|uniref:Uncharacterized protein n=1 Tax=Microdochium bolleyi TaxID=196109 RepID=A0A136IL46_9PEZI|nr:hypothetical protein Micbo1qcDRAFT_180561 [Microdochium bolleyi]
MLATYSIQALSLLCAVAMAAPAPAADGPTLSNVTPSDLRLTEHDLGIAARDVTLAAREDTVKIQYYTDYICTKYNVEFVISTNRCWNYGFSGTHSANAVSWSKDTKAQLACYYYSAKDCTGANHAVWRDGCVGDLTRFESYRQAAGKELVVRDVVCNI